MQQRHSRFLVYFNREPISCPYLFFVSNYSKRLNFFFNERPKWATHSQSGLLAAPNIGQVWPQPKQSPPRSLPPALPSIEPPRHITTPEPSYSATASALSSLEVATTPAMNSPEVAATTNLEQSYSTAAMALSSPRSHRRFSHSSTTDILDKLFDLVIPSADHLR
jgi:hypothetical protein